VNTPRIQALPIDRKEPQVVALLDALTLELAGEGYTAEQTFGYTEHRGTGVADALLEALLDYARAHQLDLVRLETGDKQRAAIAFYRRHGFVEIPRFGPYLASETSVCMQRPAADEAENAALAVDATAD